MLTRWRGGLAALCALGLVATACDSSLEPTTAAPSTAAAVAVRPTSLNLAFLGALTGTNSQLGTQIDDGVKLAVEEFNATGGTDLAGGGYEVANSTTTYGPTLPAPVPLVKLVNLDSRGNPARALTLAQRAIDQRVVAMVGPVQGAESAAAGPVLEQAGIVNVTPSATQTALADNGWKFWHRIVADDSAQAAAAASFLGGSIDAREVAVVGDSSPSGRSLANAAASDLRSAGVPVALTSSVDSQGLDDPSVAADVEAAGADAVYFAGTAREAAAFLTQLRTIGVQAVFLTDGEAASADLVQLAGAQVANGTFVICPCVDPEATPQGAAFSLAFQAAFGTAPGPHAVEGFDAANVILAAVAAGETTSLAINNYLASHKFKGVTRTITFDNRGQVTSDGMWLAEVQDGALVFQGPLS